MSDWFDSKYEFTGLPPTVNDVIELMSEVCGRITLPDRRAEKLERMLDRALLELERKEYSLSKEVTAYYLLIIACPLSQMGREKRTHYIERYRKLLEKHRNGFLLRPRF